MPSNCLVIVYPIRGMTRWAYVVAIIMITSRLVLLRVRGTIPNVISTICVLPSDAERRVRLHVQSHAGRC